MVGLDGPTRDVRASGLDRRHDERDAFGCSGLALCLAAILVGCVTTYPARGVGGIEARYMVLRGHPPSTAVATGVYRQVLSRSLYSRCQMFPSDSQLFDRHTRECGATVAAVLGVSRLYLETEASPEVLPVTFADRRLRWFDNGGPSTCAP